MQLKKQGFFREMPHGAECDPSIKQALNYPYDPTDIDNICAYLDSGKALVVCCGTSLDVINPENGVAGTPSMMTDGVWVWPGDLSYYVKKYHVHLDSEFVEFMRVHDWTVCFEMTDLKHEHVEVDGDTLW